jgi:hypothetical protein
MLGYKAGWARTIVMFFLNGLVELLLPLWPSGVVFILSYYFFNLRKHHKGEQSIESKRTELNI